MNDRMKRVFLMVCLFAIACMCMAQQNEEKEFRKRIFQARLEELFLRLKLTDEVREKFAPIYEQYCNELHVLRPKSDRPDEMGGRMPRPGRPKMEGVPPRKGGKPALPRKKPASSDAEKVKDIREKMEAQQRVQELRIAYLEKLSTILTDEQLVAFYEVEQGIQMKLHERAHRKNPPHRIMHKR